MKTDVGGVDSIGLCPLYVPLGISTRKKARS